MANDKDFLLKNAVEVGGPTKVTLGSITSGDIDLATGNYFADTPTGASTYTISNAGDVQSFQLEVTGGTEEVAQNFSTTTYAGTSASLTINNGIDLAGEDGLTWIKCRNAAEDHFLFSSLQNGSGQTLFLKSNTTGAAVATNGVSQTATGFTVPVDGMVNQTGNDYVSWTFKKEPSFFDVVTYTGTGSAQTISHNLGGVPGMIIVKKYAGSGGGEPWEVYHRGVDSTAPEDYRLILNSTSERLSGSTRWNNTVPTSTEFTLGNESSVNGSGISYVAYLFAHDDAADGLIQCGSYTGTGAIGNTITLGWEPQWIMVKNTDAGTPWVMVDVPRGMPEDGSGPRLLANASDAEVTNASFFAPRATGFEVTKQNTYVNTSGQNYIYIAIRAASDLDLTWPSSIEWAGGVAPSAPATGETDVFTLSTDDGGTSYVGVKTADNLS